MQPYISPDIIESETTNSNLARGRLLYSKGHVKNLMIIDQYFICARVQGNKLYYVFLEYGDKNYKAYCNCRYEPKGQCKHQVAVKYYLLDFCGQKNPEAKRNSTVMVRLYNRFLKNFYKLSSKL